MAKTSFLITWPISPDHKFYNSAELFMTQQTWKNACAAAWQNQQNDLWGQRRLGSACTSTQSDQSLCCLHEEALWPLLPIKCTAKTLIRRRGCTGWSESLLCAQVILLLSSCEGSLKCLILYPDFHQISLTALLIAQNGTDFHDEQTCWKTWCLGPWDQSDNDRHFQGSG